jgi:hypothetical protein
MTAHRNSFLETTSGQHVRGEGSIQADDFIKQCIEKALPLTRVFNGRKYV